MRDDFQEVVSSQPGEKVSAEQLVPVTSGRQGLIERIKSSERQNWQSSAKVI